VILKNIDFNCFYLRKQHDNITSPRKESRMPLSDQNLLRYFVSEAEYWEKYYNGPNVVYESMPLS